MPENSVRVYQAWARGTVSLGATGDGYGRAFTARRLTGAATIVQSGPEPLSTREDHAAATITISADGSGNILVQLLGVAGVDEAWTAALYEVQTT